MDAVSQTLQALWIGGLAATPLVLVIGLVCRVRMLRPSTRHLLWCAALASLAAPALGNFAEQLKSALDELGQNLGQEEKQIEKLVAERPIAALACAFAVGIVVGIALRRP